MHWQELSLEEKSWTVFHEAIKDDSKVDSHHQDAKSHWQVVTWEKAGLNLFTSPHVPSRLMLIYMTESETDKDTNTE